MSTRTVEARLESPEFRLGYWPQEIARRVEVDFALRVLKVQPAEGGLDLPTIKEAFIEVHEKAVKIAADAYRAASNGGSNDGYDEQQEADAVVEALLTEHLDSLRQRDGRNWVLGLEDTDEEVRDFFDRLRRGTLE